MRGGFHLVLGLILTACVSYVLSQRVGGVPPVGVLLDPVDGLYRTARNAEHPSRTLVDLPGLDSTVTVVRDERGVPHIFTASDKDAIMAMGYVVAQDRLFQMDFFARAASGRLAEVMGPGAVPIDRFFRQIGMELGARRNLERIRRENGVEWELVQWYAAGANAYLDGLADEDLPLEFRLLGYRPEGYRPIDGMRLLQYMTYDLSFGSDEADYARLRGRLSEEDYRLLYPEHASLFVPIVPSRAGGVTERNGEPHIADASAASPSSLAALDGLQAWQDALLGTVAEGFIYGKGSNNWAVHGSRSATGAPILADDMHLNLSLPALWYEVHLVTPGMNVYGVTFPDAPMPVQGYNAYVGWGYTNTGSDQIDHYALSLNSADTHYFYNGAWQVLDAVPDTIRVKGADSVVDTLYYSHWGPVVRNDTGAVAIRWTAHEANRSLAAIWGFSHARNQSEFEAALRLWDAPMQNVIYADVAGNIAIRSAGYLPIRGGGTGAGLLDGSTDAHAWTGRVPFEDLPHAANPAQGWLSSTNQQPADSLYPYYIGHDWPAAYRSLRISTLLSAGQQHTVANLKAYQADVHAVQRDLFAPLIDSLESLSSGADSLRLMLSSWDGNTTVDRPEPLVLFEFMQALEGLAWDEITFEGAKWPSQAILYRLLREAPGSKWLDIRATPRRETAEDLLAAALEQTADVLRTNFGWGAAHWRWGDHHKVVIRHVTRSEALEPLWRGPFEYPGFAATLSPAGDLMSTHSASWRTVIDFSKTPPEGWGVYPGGQSGNPFSPHYDAQIPAYLSFEHYRLLKPTSPEELSEGQVSSRLTLRPVG